MKIVFADMSIAKAKSILDVLGVHNIVTLDHEFGFFSLRNKVQAVPLVNTDNVYLVNSYEALNLIHEEARERGCLKEVEESINYLSDDYTMTCVGSAVKEAGDEMLKVLSQLFGV